MKNFYSHSIVILLFFLIFAACTADTTCRKDMNVRMNVTLQADSLNETQHNVRYTSWDSITVQIVGEDSLLIDNRKGLKQLSLFLQPFHEDPNTPSFTTCFGFDNVSYAITYHNQTDTLHVDYVQRYHFESLACGCAVHFTIVDAWSTDPRVDSVEIINSNVENALQENLRIHLHE